MLWLSDTLLIKYSLEKGDALSPLLFKIALEFAKRKKVWWD
jgi:hypothetical protein